MNSRNIEIKNTKVLKNKKLILDIKELTFSHNKCTVVIGKNGVGKSTLLRLVAGLENSSSSNINYNLDLETKPSEKIGYLSQSDNANLELLTANDYIEFYVMLFKLDQVKIDSLKKTFKVNDYIDTPINKLSGGQKKRLDIVFAIINNPDILIMDEFSSYLDVDIRIDIYEYMQIAKKNRTTIIATHIPKEIELFADEILLLKENDEFVKYQKDEVSKVYDGDFEEFLIKSIRGENEK